MILVSGNIRYLPIFAEFLGERASNDSRFSAMAIIEIRSPVAGVVSRFLAAGLRRSATLHGWRFITSLVTAAVGDEHRCSAHFSSSKLKVPAHHSAPASAALAEGSRADCIQICSPRVQVSSRDCACMHTLPTSFVRWQMSRLVSDFVPVNQFIFDTDCQPHPTVYRR